jgi:hypothetical protein
MKRIRQIVVALVGLFYVGLLYPLCTELWHSKWLLLLSVPPKEEAKAVTESR